MAVIEYMKCKNRFFKRTLNELLKEKEYNSIVYLVGNDVLWNMPFIEYFDPIEEQYFFDLIGIEFSDEEGNTRRMFLPVPLLEKRMLKKIITLMESGALKVVSRQWHDQYKSFSEITDFYPPTSSEEEECYSSEEEED